MTASQIPEERLQLLADIARWYYLEGLSQHEIARRVQLSRPSISRLLLDARQLGVVEIAINHYIPCARALEEQIRTQFSLQVVRVLERRQVDDDTALQLVGQLAARVLTAVLEDGMVLGLSWGTSVHAVTDALRPRRLPKVKVVQLIGGVGAPYHTIDGAEQCRRVGEMFGAQHYYLHAPLVVDTPQVAAALREDRSIREVLALGRQADVALLGIGSALPEIATTFHSGYLSYENLRRLERLGAVGAMCTSYYNIHGEHIRSEHIDDCVVGVSWEDLHHFKRTIALASGRKKAPAVLGALNTGIVDILVIDDAIAHEVLALVQSLGRP
jgi:DNA-binding transcriptional regulator LsrR (DeoR family)